MKIYSFLLVFCTIAGCGSQPSINSNYSDSSYKTVLLPHMKGDTANYVHKTFLSAFESNTDVRFINHELIVETSIELGLGANIHNASLSTLRLIAKQLEAQAIMLGYVKSGAISISSSSSIHSTIQLDLIDVNSGQTITTSTVDESMTLRERGSSLENATLDIIARYERVFARLN